MKTLFYRLLPGVLCTLLIMALGSLLSVKSRADDPRPSSAPPPVALSAERTVTAPAPIYASAPSRDCSRCESNCRHPAARSAYTCNACGAPIDADGRYASARYAREDRREGREGYEREPMPAAQVVYLVHVNGGDAQDLRAWPQSIFPLSTRWAMPIRNNCGY